MKFLNDFKNLFAIVGVVSLIFWTCASDSVSNDSNDDSSLPPQITGGTYQISAIASTTGIPRIVALNTETGVIKTYSMSYDNDWYEYGSDTPVGFDGNLVLTH
jgi:hypothetical protein